MLTPMLRVARRKTFVGAFLYTTAQYDSERELQPYFDRLLFLAGREITTFKGHANVFVSPPLMLVAYVKPQPAFSDSIRICK